MIAGTMLKRNIEYDFPKEDLFDYNYEYYEYYDNKVINYGLIEDLNVDILPVEEEINFLFEE